MIGIGDTVDRNSSLDEVTSYQLPVARLVGGVCTVLRACQ